MSNMTSTSVDTIAGRAQAKQVLKQLIQMFPNAERAHPELVQNSIDSDTAQLDIRAVHENDRTIITYEDWGVGMDSHDREKFFFKLYSSSKELNSEKRGKFGVGLVSVFLLGLEEMIVESTRGSSNWTAVVGEIEQEIFSRKLYSGSSKTKGTKITLKKKTTLPEHEEFVNKAKQAIIHYCKYSHTPIIFQGVPINVPFDLNHKQRAQFSQGGIEGVVAFSHKPSYELLNGRLLIKDGGVLLHDIPYVSVLANSNLIQTNISRNDVVDDAGYQQVLSVVRKYALTVIEKAFSRLEETAIQPQDEHIRKERHELFDMGSAYIRALQNQRQKELSKKKWFKFRVPSVRSRMLPNVLDAKVHIVTNGLPVSTRKVLKSEKVYYASPYDENSEALCKKGIVVLTQQSHETAESFLQRLDIELNRVPLDFCTSRPAVAAHITPDHERFLEYFNNALKQTRLNRHFFAIYYGTTENYLAEIPEPFLTPTLPRLGHAFNKLPYVKRILLESTCGIEYTGDRMRKELVLNINSTHLDRLIDIAKNYDFVNPQTPVAVTLALQYVAEKILTPSKKDLKRLRQFSIGGKIE